MKYLYFVSLIAAAGYMFTFLPKLRTKREPIAYWGCWAYLGINIIYWVVYAFRFYLFR